MFDMTAKRCAGVVIVLGLGLAVLLLAWGAPRTRTGGLSVTFAGLTNDASSEVLAQFKVANSLSRRVRFGVGEVQIRHTNGWPNWMRVAGGSNWLAVAPGSNVVFSVPTRSLQGTIWRVPLTYQEDPPVAEEVIHRIQGIGYGIAHWRPGRPSYRIAGRPSSFIDGPEMLGSLNQPVQGTEASRSVQGSNQTPVEAGTRP